VKLFHRERSACLLIARLNALQNTIRNASRILLLRRREAYREPNTLEILPTLMRCFDCFNSASTDLHVAGQGRYRPGIQYFIIVFGKGRGRKRREEARQFILVVENG